MRKLTLTLIAMMGFGLSLVAQVDYQRALQAYQQSGGNIAAAQAAIGTTNIPESAADLERTRTVAEQGIVEVVARPEAMPTDENSIFGRNIFGAGLTFEPNLNIATPDNYMLGPGDEVIIDVWGDAEVSYTRTISPEGTINIPRVGPLTLSGYTVKEAETRLKRSLARIYSGINSGSTSVKLTIGNIRSIQVNILGEVANPGTYTLSSLSSLFHALYAAGGVSDIGSLRNVKVLRNGEVVIEGDMYDFLLAGDNTMDITLRDGDMIRVEPLKSTVQITGNVHRPMRYETKEGETIADVINMAGGFNSLAYPEQVTLDRLREGSTHKLFTVPASEFASFEVLSNDHITVGGSIDDRYDNRATIEGAVYRPGQYAIGEGLGTLRELIATAGGLRENAFLNRALLYREKPDWTLEMVTIDLEGLMNGSAADLQLRNNDRLVITTIEGMRQDRTVTIYGAVSEPGSYTYADNMTIEDLIVDAGGLLESASTVNISVSRRIKDSESLELSNELLETFTVDIDADLRVGNDSGFVLQPFDQVYIRRSPVYITQSSVTVEGEVVFAGTYSLSHRNMRLTEAIEAAGGITPDAYVKGAYLMRNYTPMERMRDEAINHIIAQQTMESIGRQGEQATDTLSMEMFEQLLDETYSVGINLEEALKNPGGDYDIVLRDGDVITIPLLNSTVQMLGAVNYPNNVTYRSGMSVRDYVKMAGGYTQSAHKRGPIVIYMNGMVDTGNNARVEPGSIIIVPYKVKAEPISWSEITSILSNTTYSAAMIISLINMMK